MPRSQNFPVIAMIDGSDYVNISEIRRVTFNRDQNKRLIANVTWSDGSVDSFYGTKAEEIRKTFFFLADADNFSD